MADWPSDLVLLPVGLVAGALNVVAGGGSFLTLPVLIFLGLPPTVANGTNRVAVLLQSLGASVSFHRQRVWSWRLALAAAAPATAGALLGTWIALRIGDDAFRKALAFVMVAMTLLAMLEPGRAVRGGGAGAPSPWVLAGGFLFVGVYGGFVQAGVGFLALSVTTLSGLDLVRGNAIKVFCILSFSVLSLALFAWEGKVDWTAGLTLAVGSTLGGIAGARLTTLKGHRWVRRVVTVTILLFAVGLWLRG